MNPTALTVPYANQSDIAGYVKNNVVVTANYSDASTKTVTDYTVDVAGTTATIAYEGKKATVILGFNSEKEVFGVDEFKATGAEVYVTTVDGSVGTKGFVTDVLKNMDYTYFYTCGPMPMFKAIESIAKTSGQYSFEERMGCGFGACMGCTCKTKYGNKRICKDGPVLEREEIVW